MDVIDKYIYVGFAAVIAVTMLWTADLYRELKNSDAENSRLETNVLNLKRAKAVLKFECSQRKYKRRLLDKMKEDYGHTKINSTDGNYTISI